MGEIPFLPYCTVVCEDKKTTNVGVVFDTSWKSSGPSLNDCLYKGYKTDAILKSYPSQNYILPYHTFYKHWWVFVQIKVTKICHEYLQLWWFNDIFAKQSTITWNWLTKLVFEVTIIPFYLNASTQGHPKLFEFELKFTELVERYIFLTILSGAK